MKTAILINEILKSIKTLLTDVKKLFKKKKNITI